MTDLVYRGVRYRKEDLVEDLTGAAPTERVYRGVEHDGVAAKAAARAVAPKTANVYRGVRLGALTPRGAFA